MQSLTRPTRAYESVALQTATFGTKPQRPITCILLPKVWRHPTNALRGAQTKQGQGRSELLLVMALEMITALLCMALSTKPLGTNTATSC